MSSISSLRLYAQSRGTVKSNVSKPPMSTLIGQQIAPWPTMVPGLSTLKESSSSSISNATPPSSTFCWTHKRTLTPAPEPEPEPVYQPLQPVKVLLVLSFSMFNNRPCLTPLARKRVNLNLNLILTLVQSLLIFLNHPHY